MTTKKLVEWYRAKTGRAPASEGEVIALYRHEARLLNPQLQVLGDAVRAHAEREGGTTLTFCQMKWPHYWDGSQVRRSTDEIATAIGKDKAEQSELFRAVMTAVMPVVRANVQSTASPILPNLEDI